MDGVEHDKEILQWDENDVHAWFTTLGYPQYGNQIRGASLLASESPFPQPLTSHTEHRVSGDVLCLMDAESLKEVGVATIGQRLAILKAVYQLKLAQQIPIEPDDYIPPCTYAVIQVLFKF